MTSGGGKARWWRFGYGKPRGAPDPNPAASMALLQEVLDRPLDPGYQSAAQERRGKGLPPSTGSRSPLLMGFLVTVAVLQLRAPDPAAAAGRQALIDRVEAASDYGDELAIRIEVLRGEVADLEGHALVDDTSGVSSDQLRGSSVEAGAVAMRGQGVQVVIDDAPEGFSEEPGTAENRVLAHDLQMIANGLWAGGAEAIAINGQRLTTTSSIRYAGEAIVVDFRGLTRPYVIDAIGSSDELTEAITQGTTGRYIGNLRESYGLEFSSTQETEITVPAATRASIRLAQAQPVSPAPEESDISNRTDPP